MVTPLTLRMPTMTHSPNPLVLLKVTLWTLLVARLILSRTTMVSILSKETMAKLQKVTHSRLHLVQTPLMRTPLGFLVTPLPVTPSQEWMSTVAATAPKSRAIPSAAVSQQPSHPPPQPPIPFTTTTTITTNSVLGATIPFRWPTCGPHLQCRRPAASRRTGWRRPPPLWVTEKRRFLQNQPTHLHPRRASRRRRATLFPISSLAPLWKEPTRTKRKWKRKRRRSTESSTSARLWRRTNQRMASRRSPVQRALHRVIMVWMR